MAKAKKEKVEVTEENRKIGAWANGLRIVCNILKVCVVIAIVCLALVLLFVPKITKGIKISDNKIVLYGQEITYTFEEVDFLTYSIDGGKQKTVNTKDIYKYVNLMDIAKTDMKKVRNIAMVDIGFVIVICIMEFMVLNLLTSLLKRTKEDGVAFVEGGHRTLINIMWITIGIEVVGIVMGLCTAIALPSTKLDTTLNIDLGFVIAMCALYFVSLLYKRGEELQNK